MNDEVGLAPALRILALVLIGRRGGFPVQDGHAEQKWR